MVDLNFGGARKTPLLRQSEASECGLACLAMVAGFHGLKTDLIELRRRFQISLKGANLKQLMAVADDLGFSSRPLRCEIADLNQTSLPTILHWNLNHFVVLTRISKGLRGTKFHIHDPASGMKAFTETEFARNFTGVTLELLKNENFQAREERPRLKINQLWTRMQGFWPAFRQLFLLSVILQTSALVTPFFLQISIDTVLPSADANLLLVLAMGFGGIAVIAALTTWIRALVIVRLGTSLSYQVNVNLFRHLTSLPISWFERRHVGDVLSRFGSTKPISDILSQGLIAALLDGIMATVTLVLVFVYSPVLAVLSIFALILVLILRLGFFAALQQANVSLISANARENSAFIETIRGMPTIKAFGEETSRRRYWQHRKADAINAEIKTGKINATFTAGEQIILASERLIFIYVAIRYAMEGQLSIGMIFALQSYRQQFLDATIRLVQQGISFRLLDMHLTRIADIALSQPEQTEGHGHAIDKGRESVKIELRNVRFRYGLNEPEILQGINLTIEAGEMIALVGPSGGGKTTLVKIIMGLSRPTFGEVLIDDIPIESYGIARWRGEIGSVAQDDVLFAGSLGDNIRFFDEEPDIARMEASAKAASIHATIQQMPMGYHTPVGDMGSVLSGGQKQRVMLARALYRRATALVLDEATAHLDHKTEFEVGEAVQALCSTRIIVAHRPQTIARANRIFSVADGRCIALEISRTVPDKPL